MYQRLSCRDIFRGAGHDLFGTNFLAIKLLICLIVRVYRHTFEGYASKEPFDRE